MPRLKHLTAFDPSINDIGVSHLESGVIESAKTIHTKTEGNDRYAEIRWEVEAELAWRVPRPVVIEYPDSWTRKNVKELLMLSVVVGVIHATATSCGHEVYLIGTREWKGTKKKAQTHRELELQGYDLKALGWSEHARDAAALALTAEGIVKMRRIAKETR